MKGSTQVQATLHDSFWNRFREVVCQEGIPYQWKALNDELPTASPSHCMQNFRIAGGKAAGKFYFPAALQFPAAMLEWFVGKRLPASRLCRDIPPLRRGST